MTSTARPQAPWALRLLPPFPAIAHRILALASKEDVGASELGGLIKLDPSFSAELLRFANSALFGARREVTSLSQAVARLGMDRVKSMATFVALNNMVRTSVRALALRKVWVHSVVTAIIAEEAARISCLDCEIAYTTGLLHNLGTLGLMSAYPDEYSRMLEVSNDFGLDLLQTERDLFEIDHCAAGAYLALDWSFPDQLAGAIATHHDEPAANTDARQPHQGELAPDRHARLCGLLPGQGLGIRGSDGTPAKRPTVLAVPMGRDRPSGVGSSSRRFATLIRGAGTTHLDVIRLTVAGRRRYRNSPLAAMAWRRHHAKLKL